MAMIEMMVGHFYTRALAPVDHGPCLSRLSGLRLCTVSQEGCRDIGGGVEGTGGGRGSIAMIATHPCMWSHRGEGGGVAYSIGNCYLVRHLHYAHERS